MSDTCPKCGADIKEQIGIHDEWACGSDVWDGVVCRQSDKCRIAELEAELAKWKPLTPEEAQRAYDEAEAVPMSEEQIARIVKKAIDPSEALPNSEQMQLAADNTRLRNDLRLTRDGLVEALRRASELEAKCQS